MSTEKFANLSKAEEAALHELGENIAIYADQMQELAAEEHQSAGTTLYLSSGKDEFFMVHSVEDGRLTGVYYYLGVPIFRTDGHAPAEISSRLIEFVREFHRLTKSFSEESVFDKKTYERVTDDLMMGFIETFMGGE